MKKILSYRERLIELASIYKISEVNNYVKAKKNLTVPQLELILRKNRVPIPKEFNKSLIEIQSKKIFSIKNKAVNIIEDSFKNIIKSFNYSLKKVHNFFTSIKKSFEEILNFINRTTIDILNYFYSSKVDPKKTNKIVTSVAIGVTSLALVLTTVTVFKNISFDDPNIVASNKESEKAAIKKIEPKKEITKKPKKVIKKLDPKKEITKKPPEKKIAKKPSETEMILPNLNLKTETVLSLFKDVEYDLRKVRFEKKVQPIYFTQFPKDLDEIQSVKLKKETFIKIILPLVVAENEKILNDKYKLSKIKGRKITTDKEKSWLRQKLREYKVKNSNIEELQKRMDIIPVSIALAQAAKESGWGTSRFALEGNAIFGQWTWNGKGIEPLGRDVGQNHKILRFPILRASVKAYKNNLNTHKGYKKFREKRAELRKKNNKRTIKGLDLIHTLDSYAQTGAEYTKILEKIINQNSLHDFETVKLTNSKIQEELQL